MSKHRTKDIDRFARMFKALSNPHRLSVFLRLIDCCGGQSMRCDSSTDCRCVGELGEDLRIAPSTLSHHIKELHSAGLIETERKGQMILCRISPDALKALAAFTGRASDAVANLK